MKLTIHALIPLLLLLPAAPASGQGETGDALSGSAVSFIQGNPTPPGYRVNPSDVLEISVYQEPDLSRTARVSQDGYISFPLVGKVRVEGLDVLGIEDKLERLLGRDYLVNPSVAVFVKEYCAKKVFVFGEVKNPGAYPMAENRALTVLESIVLAGGFSTTAAINKTKIIRVENGVKKIIEVKIDDITRRGDKSRDIILLPGDVVLVPERLF